MQAENTSPTEGIPHHLRHVPAVDNFRSQRLKRGDSERMAKYVYSEGDYENATTDGGRLAGEGFSMRDDTTTSTKSPLSNMTSNDSQPGTVGIAAVITGITAEGEAMRHGSGPASSIPTYAPQQQPQVIQQQEYAAPPQTQSQQYAEPKAHQHDQQQQQTSHQQGSHTQSQSRFGDDDGRPVTPKATGYQQPFFSQPIKGHSR